MHVLIIAQYYPPDLGGSATRAYNIAKGLRLNNVDVTVITSFPHYPSGDVPPQYKRSLYSIEYQEGVKVLRGFILPLESKGIITRLILFACFNIFSIFALLMIRGVDVIWVANPDIFGMPPAIIHQLFSGVQIALNIDDLSIEDVENLKIIKKESLLFNIIQILTRFFYHYANVFTPISPGYVPFIETYGIPRDKIKVIRNGVDLNLFPNIIFKKSDSKFRVLYSGSFSIAYDFNQVLNAAQMMQDTHPEVAFILQGKGELASMIYRTIQKMNLKNVEILNILIPREKLFLFFDCADVLILPLKDFGVPYPGISSKLYEYQAAGKPIICCSEGSSADYIFNTKSGIIIKPGDADALVKAILYLKQNPIEYKQMSANGKRYVEKNTSLLNIGFEIKNVFKLMMRRSL